LAHLIKLVRRRTLRVQQFVARNPHGKPSVSVDQFQELRDKLDELGERVAGVEAPSDTPTEAPSPSLSQAQVVREINNTMQPELEALNRAMRRYEKKLALLASQTDNRLEYIDYRLQDAVALAAVAAKHSDNKKSLASWFLEKTLSLVVFPFHALVAVLTFPFRTASTLLRKSKPLPDRPRRNGRVGPPSQGRSNVDRVPSRVSRR
jgi:hypothetical protein